MFSFSFYSSSGRKVPLCRVFQTSTSVDIETNLHIQTVGVANFINFSKILQFTLASFFSQMCDKNVNRRTVLLLAHTVKSSYLFTPRCRVLLEKLTGLQLIKKFLTFHGPRRFITALTSVRHLSLSWASPIQSIYPHPTSWRSILILSTASLKLLQ